MSIARDIVEYVDANTSFTVGSDLFLGFLPDDKDVGISIADGGGYENETNMLSSIINIASLANDYTTSENNCQSIYNLLVYSNGFTITSGYVFNCVPLNTPTYVGLDEQQKVIVTCAVVLYKEK